MPTWNPLRGQANETGNATGNETMEAEVPAPCGAAGPHDGEVNLTELGAFTWILDFGDGNATDGSEAQWPAMANHTFLGQGLFTVVATVTFDNGTADPLVAALDVRPSGVTSGQSLGQETFSGSGSFSGNVQVLACGAVLDTEYDHPFTVPADVNGTALLVTRFDASNTVTASASSPTGEDDLDIELYDPDGTMIGIAETGARDESFTVEGPFPPGEYVFRVKGCTGFDMDYDWMVVATYESA